MIQSAVSPWRWSGGVAEAEWFGCHPCRNTSSLRLKTKDLLHVFLPHIGVTPIIVDL